MRSFIFKSILTFFIILTLVQSEKKIVPLYIIQLQDTILNL
jgi:hypothetical protein